MGILQTTDIVHRLNNAIGGIEQLLGVRTSKDLLWECHQTLVDLVDDDRVGDLLHDMGYDPYNNSLEYKLDIYKRCRNRIYRNKIDKQ